MTKEKFLNYYKKGEWLLYVAVLFQIVNLLIITIKHVESGMGVFKERFLGLVSVGFLLAYVFIELAIFIVELITYAKNKTLKEYFSQNWFKLVLKLVILTLTLIFAVWGIARYTTDRINFNLDYDTTDLVFVLALLFGCLYGCVRNIKTNWKEITVAAVLFAMIVVFVIVAKVTLSNFLWSFKANVYMLTAVFLMLFTSIGLASLKINTYISCFFGFIALVALIACSVIGGVYGFTALDLFYASRMCVILSGVLGLCFASSLLHKFAKEITKENFKQKAASLIIVSAAIVLLLVGIFFTTEIEVSEPSKMHLLDSGFLIISAAITVAFVSVMLRQGIKIVEAVFAGVVSVYTIVLIGILASKSKLVAFMPFYKTSLILSIGLTVIALVYFIYHISFKICKAVRRSKIKQENQN